MSKNETLVEETYSIDAETLEEAMIQAMSKFLEDHPHVNPESVHVANAQPRQKAN